MRLIATLLLLLAVTSMARSETLLYVSDAGNQKVVVFSVDDVSGKLTQIKAVDVKASPGSLAVHFNHVFASLRSLTFKLASFQISKSNKLELLAARLVQSAMFRHVARPITPADSCSGRRIKAARWRSRNWERRQTRARAAASH